MSTDGADRVKSLATPGTEATMSSSQPQAAPLLPHDMASKAETFHRDGYVVIGPLVTPAELDTLRQAFDELTAGYAARIDVPHDEYLDVVSQLTNVWPDHPAFAHQVHHPVAQAIARRLIGCERLQLFHDHLIIKPPHGGDAIPWHRDYPNWPLSQPRALSCWLALDDVAVSSGAMRFLPGSHRDPLTPAVDFMNDSTTWGSREAEVRAVQVPAGWAIFHHNLVWHMSPRNETEVWRRAYISILFDADLTFDPSTAGWHPMAKRFGARPGESLPVDAFPLIRGPHTS